jgi:hypothetical protein
MISNHCEMSSVKADLAKVINCLIEGRTVHLMGVAAEQSLHPTRKT